MGSPMEDMDTGDLTSSELALVTAHEKAGLVSQLACHFCGLQFDVKKTRTLRAHIEEVHVLGDAGYMCGICCEEFTSRKAVENHMSTFHRAPKPLGCGTCGETFRVRNLLLKHIDCHTKGEIDNNKVGLCYCGECFEFFDSVMSLQIHSMTHREQPVYVCGACGLQTQHRHVMIKHLETHVISNLLTASDKDHSIHELKATDINSVLIQVDSPPKLSNGDPTQAQMVVSDSTPAQMVVSDPTQVIVGGDGAVKEEEETSYKCGVCFASFVNLNEALGHAETHQEDETEMVKELDGVANVELSVFMPENPEMTEDIHTQHNNTNTVVVHE